MYRQSNTEPPWGDSLVSESYSGTAAGALGWIQEHPWFSLLVVLAAGVAIGSSRGKR